MTLRHLGRTSPNRALNRYTQLAYTQSVKSIWEQGRAKPNAQAALLINLVKQYPDTIERLAAI